jgi:hypothetical protein
LPEAYCYGGTAKSTEERLTPQRQLEILAQTASGPHGWVKTTKDQYGQIIGNITHLAAAREGEYWNTTDFQMSFDTPPRMWSVPTALCRQSSRILSSAQIRLEPYKSAMALLD